MDFAFGGLLAITLFSLSRLFLKELSWILCTIPFDKICSACISTLDLDDYINTFFRHIYFRVRCLLKMMDIFSVTTLLIRPLFYILSSLHKIYLAPLLPLNHIHQIWLGLEPGSHNQIDIVDSSRFLFRLSSPLLFG